MLRTPKELSPLSALKKLANIPKYDEGGGRLNLRKRKGVRLVPKRIEVSQNDAMWGRGDHPSPPCEPLGAAVGLTIATSHQSKRKSHAESITR